MASPTAFAPSVFNVLAVQQQAFGNGPCAGPGPCGPDGEPEEPTGKTSLRYEEGYLDRLRRIREDDEEIIMFIQMLLEKGLL